jgi:MFS family permease
MLGGLPRGFWRAAAVLAVGRSGVYIQLFLAYYLARSLGLAASQVAVVLASWGAGWAVGTPAGGWLADRLGARAVVVGGNAAAAGAYLAAGAARSFPLVVASAGLVGLTQDAWRPPLMAVIAGSARDGTERKRCMTVAWWLVQVTGIFAAVSGGVIGAEAGLRWLFPANAAAAVAAALAAGVVPGRGARARQAHQGSVMDPLLVTFTALTLVALAVEAESLVALPVRFASTGLSPLATGLVVAVNPVTCAVVQPFVQGWLVRLPAVWVCAGGMVLTGVGIALTGAGHGLAWFGATSVVWVLGEIALMGSGSAVVASIAPRDRIGSYLGVWQASMGLAVLTASAAGVALVRVGGLHLLWASCAAAGIASGAACACLAPWVTARSGPRASQAAPRRARHAAVRTRASRTAVVRATLVCTGAIAVMVLTTWRIVGML